MRYRPFGRLLSAARTINQQRWRPVSVTALSAIIAGFPKSYRKNNVELEKSFSPSLIETRWYSHWESSGYFRSMPDATANGSAPFCIMLPPPNVTGTLHMGHAFQHTLMDALIRYHRMCGDNTLWQPGTDHAGIATQIVVERQLDQQRIDRRQGQPAA